MRVDPLSESISPEAAERLAVSTAALQEASARLMDTMATVIGAAHEVRESLDKTGAAAVTTEKPKKATGTGEPRGRPPGSGKKKQDPPPPAPEPEPETDNTSNTEPAAAVTPGVDREEQRKRILTNYLEPLKEDKGMKAVRDLLGGRKLADVPDDELDALENSAQAQSDI